MSDRPSFPPFGMLLEHVRREGAIPCNEVFVCIGSSAKEIALSRFEYERFALALPPGRTPEDYCWPVSGLTALIVGKAPKDIRERTALRLLREGANDVHAIAPGERLITYGREVRRAG